MKNKIILIIVLTIFFLANCKDAKKKNLTVRQNPPILIQDFKEFFEVFKKAVKERDKKTIEQLASDKFCYITNDEREKLSRNEAIEQFDFDLAEKLIIDGISVELYGKSISIPKFENIIKNKGYKIHFINNGTGWQIQNIFKGPIKDIKQ